MIKIEHKREAETLNHLPVEVINVVLEITAILDKEYGGERNVDGDLGGYILIVEAEKDIELVSEEIGIDITDAIPEYVDLVRCNNKKDYTNSLVLCNNDFGISIMIPLPLTPKELLDYMGQ